MEKQTYIAIGAFLFPVALVFAWYTIPYFPAVALVGLVWVLGIIATNS